MNKAAPLLLAICLSVTVISCNNPGNPNPANYDILAVKSVKKSENYYIYYKGDRSEDNLNAFALNFRDKDCKGNCNILIFDTDEVKEPLKKGHYDLQGEDSGLYADHLIGQLTSDSKTIKMYPLKEAQ